MMTCTLDLSKTRLLTLHQFSCYNEKSFLPLSGHIEFIPSDFTQFNVLKKSCPFFSSNLPFVYNYITNVHVRIHLSIIYILLYEGTQCVFLNFISPQRS